MVDDAAADAPAAAAPEASPSGGREKRVRKQPEVFKPDVKEKEDFVIKQGAGSKLGDIPNVRFKLSKLKPDDDVVVDLHKTLYSRPGVATKRKRDIFEFSGFAWLEEESKDARSKASEKMTKINLASITQLCDVFELSKEGKKEDKIARIVEFLEAPKTLGTKDLAGIEAKKKEKKKQERERKAKKEKRAATAKAGKKGKKASAEEEEDKEEDEEEEPEEDEEPEEEEEEPAAKKQKKAPTKAKKQEEEEEEEDGAKEEDAVKGKKATPAAKAKKPTPAKKAAKKPAEAKPKKAKKADEVDVEMEDAAAADAPVEEKAGKAESPTDETLKDAVRCIVAGVDLSSFSLKNLLKDLEDKFPDVTFSSERKKFIKAFVIEIIQPAEGAAPAVPEDAAADSEAAEPKEEAKEAPKDETMEEPKDEAKEEPKDEPKDEPKEEPKEEAKEAQ